MLTLARRWERPIYSLSAKVGEVKGYMGFGPKLCVDRYRTSAGDRSSGGSWGSGHPVSSDVRWMRSVKEAPVIRNLHTSVNIHSVGGVPDVR